MAILAFTASSVKGSNWRSTSPVAGLMEVIDIGNRFRSQFSKECLAAAPGCRPADGAVRRAVADAIFSGASSDGNWTRAADCRTPRRPAWNHRWRVATSCLKPRRPIGRTAASDAWASRPMPARKGCSSPVWDRRPSGKISTWKPRSSTSPAWAKLRRNPARRGKGKGAEEGGHKPILDRVRTRLPTSCPGCERAASLRASPLR